ncbi:MAG: hypothetical protein ACREQ9_16050 [Candidatus Binatia bacterium]
MEEVIASMGKPRKSPEPTENPCCVRERERCLRQIARTYSAFPVIKDVVCPQCRQWIRLRIYDRAELERTG